MNDFEADSVPEFLYGVIDTEKRLSSTGDLQGSPYSFPYYLKSDECPEQLLLICEHTEASLHFDYYKMGMGHLASDKLLGLINNLRCSKYISKKLIALNVKGDQPIRLDLNYIYFLNNESLIDEDASKFEEDKFGNLMPHSLNLNNDASAYDIFTINKTLLSGYMILSSVAADMILESSLAGVKIVALEDAFKHHCEDYHYDIELSKKPKKRKIP